MLKGLIEGFYGRPWNDAQRQKILGWTQDAGMNTFIYAPKDDVHVRARWREIYDEQHLKRLRWLSAEAARRGQQMFVAIAPCIDMIYSNRQDLARLIARVDQLGSIGIDDIVLLFDDIPNRLNPVDSPHFGSFAAAQVHVANAVMDHLRGGGSGRLLFCPTEYCARFADNDVLGSQYLNTLGRTLDAGIDVFWTGPEIVSPEITAASLIEIGGVLSRKPVIWDNFHANDYDIRRIHLGPLGGRTADILPLIAGFITNPNNEPEANFIPIHTTGTFLAGGNADEELALSGAIAAWRAEFALAYRTPPEYMSPEDIRLLVDLFYQPFACGPQIETALQTARHLLRDHRQDSAGADWQEGRATICDLGARIDRLFDCLTELTNRELFHTLHAYIWEAREEMKNLNAYLDWLETGPAADAVFPAETMIHNFYRLGFTSEIQQILKRDVTGRYHHAG